METYKQQRARHQKEIAALDIGFAFSVDQYRKQLEAWNITEAEAEAGAILDIGGGGFIRATDKELYLNTVNRIDAEIAAAIEADTTGTGYIYEMFLTELQDHEYCYTGSVWETLDALGITNDDLEENEALATGLNAAREALDKAGDIFTS